MAIASRKVDVYPLSHFISHHPVEGEEDEYSSGGGNTGTVLPPPGTSSAAGMPRKDYSQLARSRRLQQRIDRDGAPVRSVEGVLLVHVHNHPHVLLFRQRASTLGVLPLTGQFGTQAAFRLPGGRCRKDEPEVRAMYRKLGRTLLGDPKAAPPLGATGTGASSNISNTAGSTTGVGISSLVLNAGGGGAVGMNEDSQPPVALGGAGSSAETHFRVGEVLGVWYRPSLDRHMYPYCPPHVTRPMEVRTIFLIHVLDVFSAASAGGLRLVTGGGYDGQMELVAVPLFELMDNAGKYGIVASSIPYVVSRLHINFC